MTVTEEIVVRPRRIKTSLNKELLKENISFNEFNEFKTNLSKLINDTNKALSGNQGEENIKNLLSDFLKDSFYKNKHFINTMSYKGRNEADLVIHSESSNMSNVSVIIEVKTSKNNSEMLSKDIIEKKSPDNLLKKSFYESVLYFFHEFVGKNNIELKNIVITNVFDFFVFSASEFKRVFIDRSKELYSKFQKWKSEGLIDSKTGTFYDIIKNYISEHPEYLNNLRFTYFDIREVIQNEEELKLLYKFLSPKNLLKQNLSNDSNVLNKEFYNELLHIIGLEEVEKGSQRLIQRKKSPDDGSLLENTIRYIKENNKISNLENKNDFGLLNEDRIFYVSLSLCITWINRILFLKLLEGQLFNYHNKDINYKFLDFKKVKTFKRLNRIFFSVLAEKIDKRESFVQEFFRIPYLNSSLFEKTKLENQTLDISALEDDLTLSLYKNTVLKDENRKKLKDGKLTTLEYLLNFLNSYDFGAEDNTNNEVLEERKTLINASVLGLIFEKINGYKDGSFYTPSFITTYMCRESISRSIIQKFNDKYSWECETLEELEFLIYKKKIDLEEANDLVNSIKICDPAVGSGHFLVSALNEIISIKSQLSILCDVNGKRLLCHIENKNDELEIRTKDDELFEYKVKSYKESGNTTVSREIVQEISLIQESIFIEKKNIIENNLFGVDINNNSVMICRLRLWIELLKNAFYKNTNESKYLELETLPNIDINIKQGDSLISRYTLDQDLKKVFKKKEFGVKDYRQKVKEYKETNNKDKKEGLEKEIENIKNEFKKEISSSDNKKMHNLELDIRQRRTTFLELDKASKKKIVDMETELNKLKQKKLEYEQNDLYQKAFEWRFSFPEVLDDNGDFVGFDIIIGNPPYIQIQNFENIQKEVWKEQNYQTFEATGDIYCLFYERGNKLLNKKGYLCYITSNKWMRTGYGKSTRKYFAENTKPLLLVDFGGYKIFDNATVDTNILLFDNHSKTNECVASSLQRVKKVDISDKEILDKTIKDNSVILDELSEENWVILSVDEYEIKKELERIGTPLKDWDISINYGIKTGLNDAFIISEKQKNELIKLDSKNEEIIKTILRGRDIKKYKAEFANLYLINTHNGYKNNKMININDYPVIKNHLDIYFTALEKRYDKGTTPYNLRNCAYLDEFDKEKIIFQEMVQESSFCFDKENKYYCLDTARIITGDNIKFLISILNSKLFFFSVKTFYGGGGLGSNGIRMKSTFFEKFPVPEIDSEYQQLFEMMVDFILYSKENNLESESDIFESIIDNLVYDLYFPKEMKEGNCYITDRIKETVKPFQENDDDEFKKEYIKSLYKFFLNDKTIYRGLKFKHLIKVVKIISGNSNG
jgi:adenine-specific DNA-methyltransferase